MFARPGQLNFNGKADLAFVRLANLWYADIPEWEGSTDSLEMNYQKLQ